jgi:hypothetical protein
MDEQNPHESRDDAPAARPEAAPTETAPPDEAVQPGRGVPPDGTAAYGPPGGAAASGAAAASGEADSPADAGPSGDAGPWGEADSPADAGPSGKALPSGGDTAGTTAAEATAAETTAPETTAPEADGLEAAGSEAATPAAAAAEAKAAVGAGAGAGAEGGAGAPDVTPDGGDSDLTSDEAALRALMHSAVDGLPASPDALEHLRRAVPLRRQRRRQAMLGAAAAVLLVGLAVPAVVRAAGTSGDASASPADAGSSYAVTPHSTGHPDSGTAGPPGAPTSVPGYGSRPAKESAPAGAPPKTDAGGPPAPDCSSAQLGQGVSKAGSPDSSGRVYGWFRVSNVSDTPCTVPSGGIVQAVAHGSADQGAIQVVDHTRGDPASGLPVSSSNAPVVLSPGQDYEVAFAWVPDTTKAPGCAATTTPPTTPSSTPTVTATDGTDQSTDSSGTDDAAQPPDGDPPASPPASSVTLNHTPAAGAPVVDGPVIQGACAGTVYTTPPMPEPDTAPPAS